ncbi:hypothetical protein Tco_1219073 [Tanacetum coccineum]
MGNGADTSLWEDVWRGGGDFKSIYPRIYALETCKNLTVAVKISQENVGYSLHRIPRGGIEQVQFLVFLASMEGVALVDMSDRVPALKSVGSSNTEVLDSPACCSHYRNVSNSRLHDSDSSPSTYSGIPMVIKIDIGMKIDTTPQMLFNCPEHPVIGCQTSHTELSDKRLKPIFRYGLVTKSANWYSFRQRIIQPIPFQLFLYEDDILDIDVLVRECGLD